MEKHVVSRYSTTTKILHWLVAIIVLSMLSLSFFMGDVPDSYAPLVYMTHKSFGLTILGLMIIRILWMSMKGRPGLPETIPAWERYLARTVQYALYLLLLAMPLSGWIMSVAANKTPSFFGLFNVPLPIEPNKPLAHFMNETHEVFAWVIIALVLLHILGALKHYFIDKDKVLQSMWKS